MKLSILNQFIKLSFAIILLLIVFSSQLIIAGEATLSDGIILDGTMRWRIEFDGKDFSNSTAMNELSYLRTRLGLKITSIENTLVYIQMQDSRNLGTNSSGLTNDTNLGLHQGYIKLSEFPLKSISFQVGRFEAVYGRQRLMGSVGWHNVGRSFDGGRFSYVDDAYKIDLFSLKIHERSFTLNHKDHVLYGIYSTFMEKKLDLFFLYNWDQQTNNAGDANLKRITTGTYVNHALESGIYFDFDGAFQFGKESGDDVSAFMFAGEISKKYNSRLKKIGLGFDITSGDDVTSADVGNFNNLYYTGHKFNGFMDLFVGSPTYGLMDLYGKIEFVLIDDVLLLVDLHHFTTMQGYSIGANQESKSLGFEIDLTAKYEWRNGLACQGGISAFSASNNASNFYFGNSNNDTAFWIYTMITAGF